MVKTISVHDLQQLLAKNKNTMIIDVREPAENAAECIDGTCLIPLKYVSIDKLPSTQGPIVIHCGSGIRSAKACETLLAQNPNLEVYSLEGGIQAWKASGCEVKCASNKMDINRQVQITAGSLTLAGILLGAIWSAWFYIIPGIIGAGLIYSGISGTCNMGSVLCKMPWNR